MTKKTYEMQEDALQQLEDIKTILKLSALNEAVNKSIAIAHRIIEEKQKGSDILINKKPFDFFGI
jgi:DNA helicase IV